MKQSLEDKKKHLARWPCGNCKNTTYYLEFDNDWHGMRVMRFTCTKCGVSPVWSQATEASKFLELQFIKEELKVK